MVAVVDEWMAELEKPRAMPRQASSVLRHSACNSSMNCTVCHILKPFQPSPCCYGSCRVCLSLIFYTDGTPGLYPDVPCRANDFPSLSSPPPKHTKRTWAHASFGYTGNEGPPVPTVKNLSCWLHLSRTLLPRGIQGIEVHAHGQELVLLAACFPHPVASPVPSRALCV